MNKVYSKGKKAVGICTGSIRNCRMEGCTGQRLGVRWEDGKITFPCTKGMKTLKNGDMEIL